MNIFHTQATAQNAQSGSQGQNGSALFGAGGLSTGGNFFAITLSQIDNKLAQSDLQMTAQDSLDQKIHSHSEINQRLFSNAQFYAQEAKSDFGKAYNYDPVLNLSSQNDSEALLSSLDSADSAALIDQLIGALPSDVRQKAFETLPVRAGIQGVESLNLTSANAKALHPEIEALISAQQQAGNDLASSALIATGLTPQQISELTSSLTEEEFDALDGINATLLSILPPQNAQKTDIMQKLKTDVAHIGENGQSASSADLKALKALIDQLAPLNKNNGTLDLPPSKGGADISFDSLLESGDISLRDLRMMALKDGGARADKTLPFANKAGAQGTPAAATNANAQAASNAATQSAVSQMLNSASGLVPWDSLDEAKMLDIPLERMSIGQLLHNTAHTSPTLMHASAATPHQSTQAIAAKMIQAAQNNGDTEINIELDPPELGRVKITMIQNRDGGIKAELSFDKPETYLMMQRDASQLEKALSEAGIDTGETAIEFSLSSDNESQNDGESNEGQFASGAEAPEGEGEQGDENIINVKMTQMDWYTDASGNLRLDMMV